MKSVIILRAVSGSGKTTFANYLESISKESTCICAADDYFSQSGEYKFDATLLPSAHIFCREKFKKALSDGIQTIIVANTNTKESEFTHYIDVAKQYNYQVFSVVIENRHGNTNIHNVPQKSLDRQKENIYNSLKLN